MEKLNKRKMLSKCYYVFLLCFILLSLAGKYAVFPILGGWQMKTVLSGSMEPVIPTGSLIFLRPISKDEVRINDIITFSVEGYLVTHRVMEIQEGRIKTKGDSNQQPDVGVADQIIGKVYYHIPKIGIFFQIIQTKRGTFALGMTVVTFILLDMFVQLLWNEKTKEKPKRKLRKKYEKKYVI